MPYMLSHFHLPHEVQVRVELSVPHRWGSRDKKYPTTPTTPTTVLWGYGSSWTFPELGEDLVGVGGTQVGGWWWRGWGLVVLVELICQLVQVVVWCEDFCLKSQECWFLGGAPPRHKDDEASDKSILALKCSVLIAHVFSNVSKPFARIPKQNPFSLQSPGMVFLLWDMLSCCTGLLVQAKILASRWRPL